MTREEAIEFGKMWLELQEDYKDSNTYEFFKMAIEALQQEPTYTSEVAQKAYEDGKKDGYIERKIETINENDLEVDCVSRQAVERLVWEYLRKPTEENVAFYEYFLELPSVTPQEPRKGHWEVVSDGYSDNAYICECSECKDTVWVYKDADRKWNYCPNCGTDMREVEE